MNFIEHLMRHHTKSMWRSKKKNVIVEVRQLNFTLSQLNYTFCDSNVLSKYIIIIIIIILFNLIILKYVYTSTSIALEEFNLIHSIWKKVIFWYLLFIVIPLSRVHTRLYFLLLHVNLNVQNKNILILFLHNYVVFNTNLLTSKSEITVEKLD